MNGLPQVHDWFLELLQPGQWVFVYIIAFIVLTIFFAWVFLKSGDFDSSFGAAFAVGLALPPLAFGAIFVLLSFVSFMIWLWCGTPVPR